MKKIIYLLALIFFFSCQKKVEQHCEILKLGTFDVYQKDKKVGTIYRKDSIQIEKYVDNSRTGITKFYQSYKCEFVLRSYIVKQKLDTMHFTANYTIRENNVIDYEMTPTYADTGYKLKGKIVKVSDSIDAKTLKMFTNLTYSTK